MKFSISKTLLCLSLIFLLFSCEKEVELTSETVQTEVNTSNPSSLLGEDEDCSDEILPEHYHLNSRSSAWHIYNDLLEDDPMRAQFGKPYYGAVLSEFDYNTRSSYNTVPLYDYETEELKTILFLGSNEIGSEEYFYTFWETSLLEKLPETGWTFEHEGETVTITSDDYLAFKNYFNCLATCDQEGIITRGGGCCVNCQSWWQKFKKWWTKIFKGTNNTGFPIHVSWVPDADPFWTGTGQGPKFNPNKGGSSYTPPPYLDNVDRLKFCFGFEDPYDVDNNSGGNENATHPDAEFCAVWQRYMDDCFGSIPYEDQEEFYDDWGQNMYYENSLFNEIIANPDNC